MRAVNLLPSDVSQQRRPNKTVLVGAASSSAVLMLLGAAYVHAHGTVKNRQSSLAELKAELAALPPRHTSPTAGVDAQLIQERAARVSAPSAALSQRVRWDRLFRELSIVLPGDVWLETLTASAPTPATAAPVPAAPGGSTSGTASAAAATTVTSTTFNIQGQTYTQEGVARLLIHLQLVPDLQNVQLASSQLQDDNTVQFTINADIKAPEAGS